MIERRGTRRPLLAALVLTLAAAGHARAEVYLAATEGYRCSQCHVNRTGGGMRTEFGALFAQTTLPLWVPERRTEGGLARLFQTGQAGPVRFGGDLRGVHRTVRGDGERDDTNEFKVDEGTLFLEADLYDRRLTLYVDEQIAPGGSSNREAFGLVSFPLRGDVNKGWVKVGQFFPPFGLRVLDDGTYTRSATGFSFSNSDQGVEVGFEPGRWQIALSLTNGTQGAPETNDQKQVCAWLDHVRHRWRVGGSYTHNTGDELTRQAYGVHGTFRAGHLVLLGEVDLVRDAFATYLGRPDRDQLATLLEARWWVARGQNVRLTWDTLDPDRDIATDTRERFTVGYEAFLMPNLEVRANAVIRDGPPQYPEYRDDSLTLELHLFF